MEAKATASLLAVAESLLVGSNSVFSCSRRLDSLPFLEFCRLDLLSKKINFSVFGCLIGVTTCGHVVYGACAMTRT